MINYDMPNSMVKAIEPLLNDLFIIDSDENDITVYQDFVEKHKTGVPSGVKIKSKSKIYPCAIPDIGCGFRVVKFEGISKSDIIGNENLITKMNHFLNGKADLNIIKEKQTTIEKMLRLGHSATSHLFTDVRKHKYENNGCYDVDSDHKYKQVIFPDNSSTSLFNKYQGHFLELLEPLNNSNDSIYLLIHTGSSILANNFINYYYPLLAKMSYINKWATENEVLAGKFSIPKNCEIVDEYYNDIKSLLNFSIAYRDLIECSLTELIKNELKNELQPVILSDYSHTKLEITEEHITHQRGIQFLKKSDENQYVISGNFGIGSLLFKSNVDQFFSHGVQVNTDLCSDILPESKMLLSNNSIKNNEKLEVIKQASLAKIAYDFYLAKDISFVDYLIPFYSFKEEG